MWLIQLKNPETQKPREGLETTQKRAQKPFCWKTQKQNHTTHQIEQKTQRRVRDEEKRKEKEKSNLKRQKSTWFCRWWAAPAEAGAGRWCLGPWSRRLEGEGTEGGWVFWREIWEGGWMFLEWYMRGEF